MVVASGHIACPAREWETTLLDPVFRLGLNQRLGFPAPGTGQQSGRTPPGGKRCQHILDPYGRHAACCTKGLHTRRHDRIRDLIVKLARQAGLTATAEQAMLMPLSTLSDSYWANPPSPPINSILPSSRLLLGDWDFLIFPPWIARASCIATLPRAVHTDSFRHTLVRQEGDGLLERLQGNKRRGPQELIDIRGRPFSSKTGFQAALIAARYWRGHQHSHAPPESF